MREGGSEEEREGGRDRKSSDKVTISHSLSSIAVPSTTHTFHRKGE